VNTRQDDSGHSELVRVLRQWSLVAVVLLNFLAIVGYATRLQNTLDTVRATEARHCDLTRDALVLAVEASRRPNLTAAQSAVADRIAAAFREIDCSP